MLANDGLALLAAAVQAACAAKAPRRTVAAVAAAVAAIVSRPIAAAAAPSSPCTAEPDCVPGGWDAAGDEKRRRLREARKAKRQLKRQRRRENAQAVAASPTPMESQTAATPAAVPMSDNAKPSLEKDEVNEAMEVTLDDAEHMSDVSLGKRKQVNIPAFGGSQASVASMPHSGSWRLAEDGSRRPAVQLCSLRDIWSGLFPILVPRHR